MIKPRLYGGLGLGGRGGLESSLSDDLVLCLNQATERLRWKEGLLITLASMVTIQLLIRFYLFVSLSRICCLSSCLLILLKEC
jgi:hypothetical protein